jgi:hypothetical protein
VSTGWTLTSPQDPAHGSLADARDCERSGGTDIGSPWMVCGGERGGVVGATSPVVRTSERCSGGPSRSGSDAPALYLGAAQQEQRLSTMFVVQTREKVPWSKEGRKSIGRCHGEVFLRERRNCATHGTTSGPWTFHSDLRHNPPLFPTAASRWLIPMPPSRCIPGYLTQTAPSKRSTIVESSDLSTPFSRGEDRRLPGRSTLPRHTGEQPPPNQRLRVLRGDETMGHAQRWSGNFTAFIPSPSTETTESVEKLALVGNQANGSARVPDVALQRQMGSARM